MFIAGASGIQEYNINTSKTSTITNLSLKNVAKRYISILHKVMCSDIVQAKTMLNAKLYSFKQGHSQTFNVDLEFAKTTLDEIQIVLPPVIEQESQNEPNPNSVPKIDRFSREREVFLNFIKENTVYKPRSYMANDEVRARFHGRTIYNDIFHLANPLYVSYRECICKICRNRGKCRCVNSTKSSANWVKNMAWK